MANGPFFCPLHKKATTMHKLNPLRILVMFLAGSSGGTAAAVAANFFALGVIWVRKVILFEALHRTALVGVIELIGLNQ